MMNGNDAMSADGKHCISSGCAAAGLQRPRLASSIVLLRTRFTECGLYFFLTPRGAHE
jgi:hypothetical protein